MKKSLVILLILLLIPLFSAAEINMKDEYNIGETAIAKIQASFAQDLTTSNIKFYRGYNPVAFDYDLGKIGDYYYLKVSLEGKTPNNYTVKIEDSYYYSGGVVISDDIVSNFTINSEIAAFSIDPGFVVSSDSFTISAKSLSDLSINVGVSTPSEIDSVISVIISPGQTKNILFTFDTPLENLEDTITLSYSSTSYEIPVYIFGSAPSPECGDSVIDSGELCDGDNWGEIVGCEDFGFDSGTLSCRSPGSYLECTFNTLDCFNSSSPEEKECGNGIIESGEQCDGSSWGKIKSCTYFGFDAGKLKCTDCEFNTEDCYNYNECEDDRDCNDGYECDNGNCVKIDNYCDRNSDCEDDEYCDNHRCKEKECEEDSDCEDDEECDDYECVEKRKECDEDSDCRSSDECDSGFCVPIEKECIQDEECGNGKECDNYKCVDKEVECTTKSDCKIGEVCVNNECIDEADEKTCTEQGGKICATDQTCDGDYQEINGRVCCLTECKDQGGSSTGKLIGWGLLVIIVIGLVFFYFKFKKTKGKKPDLNKIATAPRVKDNLLR